MNEDFLYLGRWSINRSFIGFQSLLVDTVHWTVVFLLELKKMVCIILGYVRQRYTTVRFLKLLIN